MLVHKACSEKAQGYVVLIGTLTQVHVDASDHNLLHLAGALHVEGS